DALGDRLPRALRANAHSHRVEFARAAARLSPAGIRARLEHVRQRPRECLARAGRAVHALLLSHKARVVSLAMLVDAFSYHKVLERGLALVRDAAAKPIRTAAAVSAGDILDLEFGDGHVPAVAGGGGTSPRKRRGGGAGGQGSLFG